jgi:hypothetical protein
MNKIDKFRGLLEIQLKEDTIVLNSLKVNDLFDLLLLSKQEEQFQFGCDLLTRILSKSFDEPEELIEQFVIENYVELLEGLMIALGWTTKKKIEEIKLEKDKPKVVKKGLEALKARAALEADNADIEDKYITTCYVLMREFKYTWEYILNMPATVFLIIIDEMNKQNEKEKEEMAKNKPHKH